MLQHTKWWAAAFWIVSWLCSIKEDRSLSFLLKRISSSMTNLTSTNSGIFISVRLLQHIARMMIESTISPKTEQYTVSLN